MKKGGGGVDMDDDGDTPSSPPLAMLTIATSANEIPISQSGQFQKDSLTYGCGESRRHFMRSREVIEKCMHWMDALEELRIGWDGECELIGVDVVVLWWSVLDILALG